MARPNIAVEIVRRPRFAKGFVLLPKRGRVEQEGVPQERWI